MENLRWKTSSGSLKLFLDKKERLLDAQLKRIMSNSPKTYQSVMTAAHAFISRLDDLENLEEKGTSINTAKVTERWLQIFELIRGIAVDLDAMQDEDEDVQDLRRGIAQKLDRIKKVSVDGLIPRN